MAGMVTIDLSVDTEPVKAGAIEFDGVVEELTKTIQKLQAQLEETFQNTQIKTFAVDMQKYTRSTREAIASLKRHFSELKTAVTEAAAPIGSVFIPVLDRAVQSVAGFVKNVGSVLGALLGGTSGTESLKESVEEATEAETKLQSAAVSAGKAVKRSLAGFDEITRLSGTASASTAASTSTDAAAETVQLLPETVTDTLSPQLQAIVEKLLALVEPLKNMDFSPAMQALRQLGQGFSQLGDTAGGAMEALWFDVLTPLAAWIAQTLAPVLLQTLTAALEAVTAAIQPVISGAQSLWQALQPVAAFIGETVVTVLTDFKKAFESLAQVFTEKGAEIQAIFSNIGTVISTVWGVIQPVLHGLREQFSQTFGEIGSTVSSVVGFILDALYGLSRFLSGAFTGDWKTAWDGLVLFLKGIVNSVIGLMNTMLSKIVGALNAVIRTANKLSFTVPEWVPGIGGEVFGFNLKTISTPQIPYLAQGAVIPPNREFLAVLGDQSHGTNIEAPLSTIQEAVANVMGDQLSAMMAGFQALLEENQRLRQVVEEIELGDKTIGEACHRYDRKLAVAKGGGA